MILRYKDVRAAAKDWQSFSSDAPFRVPIPSEEDVRTVRQLPIETNPPEHSEYRKIVEPFFRRPTHPDFIARMERLVSEMLNDALASEKIEVVRQFALPLQSRALTFLLAVPEAEAAEWISWGTHVFRDGGNGERKGAALEAYIHRQLDRASERPGEDFFSALTTATFQGRPLTREEMVGFSNLTFAGGRDTIINSVSSILAYFGDHPEALAALRLNPAGLTTATEEFVRVISPLTHIGRVCPVTTDVQGVVVEADQRVSLCWASANYDETVFTKPEEILLDRKPNPHIGFGSGVHQCLGAPHARLLIRTLLRLVCDRVERITILSREEHVEREEHYERHVGYDSLLVSLSRRLTGPECPA